MVGHTAPLRSLVHSIGLSTTVVVNERVANAVALPSTTLVKGNKTVVVVGDESAELISSALSQNVLYGGHHNVITPDFVSAVWNGVIAKEPATLPQDRGIPAIVVGGETVVPLNPDNAVLPATHFVFVTNGATDGALSEDEAIKRLVQLTDEKKTEAIKAILKGAKLSVVGKAATALSLL